MHYTGGSLFQSSNDEVPAFQVDLKFDEDGLLLLDKHRLELGIEETEQMYCPSRK
jgi:hypothetical protein